MPAYEHISSTAVEMTTMHPHLPCVKQPAATHLAPNSNHPPPSLIHARARASSCSSNLSMVSGHSHRSRCYATTLSADAASTARSLQAISSNQDTKLRTDKFFELEMSVRESELDQYGVVNHVIYPVYIDNAREQLLTGLGISSASVVCAGNAMALSELNLKYRTPLRRGGKFVVGVRVVQIKGARIRFEQFIETLPERELVLEVTATAVCLNKDHRPTRVFPEMSSKLQQFFSSHDG
ncbi:acyl-acyl carrier protein thioesterase TE3, chloroplastic-like [Lolium rigidum]|uniref:acyl-acyl carrier protein thioesterase TE3, chloroplastic-like n=1 Tax=Lolium rigidum TaxID=89674 RepID=UPI001F5DA085|nr:acyl-acyl carrier protein thioesterase TE3, chloroplastic-like [Lolium rigidum]